jgi:hypothetical protein
MVDKRRGCNPRIVEQVTLYAHLRTLSSDLASSEAQSSSLDRSSSALKKTLRAPFHVLWNVRRPVRASDGKGTDLPESEFVSDSGTTSWTTKLHMPDLSRARSRTTGNRIAQLSVFLCLSARCVRSHTTRGHVERECRPENIDICTKHKHNKHVSPLPYPSSTQGGR